jgi:ribose transport system substrate-binding protein
MQRRISSLVGLTAVGAALTLLVGCSATAGGGHGDITTLVQANGKVTYQDLTTSLGVPTGSHNTTLCYVTRTLSNEFWGFENEGFEAEAKKRGVQYKTFDVTDESSITEQLDKAKSAMNQGCDAILTSPISATGLDSVFSDAIAKGVPAIVLNDAKSTLPGTVYVGPDALTIGKTAADYIANKLPNGGKVAMIEGDPGSSNALNRGQGFKNGLTSHPTLNLVASQTANWDQTKAEDIATAMLTANPDLAAFYVQNDTMALGVIAAVANAHLTGKVLVVGNDGIPEAKKQIQQGAMTATVSERPVTEGTVGVDAALWLLAGKKVPEWIDAPAFVIDAADVGHYQTGMP